MAVCVCGQRISWYTEQGTQTVNNPFHSTLSCMAITGSEYRPGFVTASCTRNFSFLNNNTHLLIYTLAIQNQLTDQGASRRSENLSEMQNMNDWNKTTMNNRNNHTESTCYTYTEYHVETLELEAVSRATLGTVDVVAKRENYLHSTNE